MKAVNQNTSGDGAPMSMNDLDDLYSKPDTDENIVDVLLMIMDDDGPKPMRNLRPAQKHRNGAEQFNMEHQEEFEARGRQTDKVTRVGQHNNAFPKMYDELDKRKSMLNTKAIESKVMPHKESQNNKKMANGKRKHLKVTKKSKVQGKCRRSSVQSMRRESRVTKPKSRCQRNSFRSQYKMYQLSKLRVNKGCQYTQHLRNVTTSDVAFKVISETSDDQSMGGTRTKIYEFDHDNTTAKKKSKTSIESNRKEGDDIGSRIPDTSQPSISSYNSYMSMDHEPMVAP